MFDISLCGGSRPMMKYPKHNKVSLRNLNMARIDLYDGIEMTRWRCESIGS